MNIEKIEVKKTKTSLTISLDVNENYNSEEFKKLLAIAVLSGGSANCIRQTLKSKSGNLDFELLKDLQQKASDLIYTAVKEIERVESPEGINTETIKFI